MNKRRQNIKTDEDDLIVIDEHEPPKTFCRRILYWFGEAILWLLALAPGVLICIYGVNAIQSEKLTGTKGFRTTSYGDDAVGWGWIFVAVGFWALGQCCHLKTGRVFLNLLGWILAVCAFGFGLWILLRRFVNHPA